MCSCKSITCAATRSKGHGKTSVSPSQQKKIISTALDRTDEEDAVNGGPHPGVLLMSCGTRRGIRHNLDGLALVSGDDALRPWPHVLTLRGHKRSEVPCQPFWIKMWHHNVHA
jgi:hypothetical protein